MRKQNLEHHPKFTVINAATRFSHFTVQKLIEDHKNEVVDFGFKTVGKALNILISLAK